MHGGAKRPSGGMHFPAMRGQVGCCAVAPAKGGVGAGEHGRAFCPVRLVPAALADGRRQRIPAPAH